MKTKLPNIIPGPYRVVEEKHDDGSLIIRSDPRGGGDVPGDLVVALVVGGGPEEYEHGTAAMLAAAPVMHAALTRYTAAIEALGKIKNGKTLFELNPSQDDECCAAWLELNAAGKDAQAALSMASAAPSNTLLGRSADH